jgi:hypothetical protein
MEVLFLHFLLELTLAANRDGVVLNADVQVLLLDARDFYLENDILLRFVDVDPGGE